MGPIAGWIVVKSAWTLLRIHWGMRSQCCWLAWCSASVQCHLEKVLLPAALKQHEWKGDKTIQNPARWQQNYPGMKA